MAEEQYVFHGCTIVVGYDETTNSRVVFIVNRDGGLAFQAPEPLTIMRKYTPPEVDIVLQHIPPSPMKEAIEKAWETLQEPPS